MRVIDFFDRGAALAPDRICLKDANVARSYDEVRKQSCRIANALIRDGFAPQDKAAVLSPNAAAPFECVLGILRAGGAWVPVNARNVASENAYILDNCDVETLFYHGDFEAAVQEFRRLCPKIQRYVCIDRTGGSGVFLEEWLGDAPDSDPDLPEDPDAVVSIVSSGGTTGRPKGVMWSNRTWEALFSNYYASMPNRKPPVHLVIAPMTHAAGILAMLLMATGATHVILPHFDAAQVAQAIEREKVTHLFLPPTAVYMLLAYPKLREHDYSSLDYFLYAAAPMSVDKLKQCLEVFGPVMTQCFGQAEAPMLCTYLSPQEHLVIGDLEKEKRLSSCGRPTLLTPVAIMDDDGKLLARGECGEIVVRGSLVMPGYYKNPEATKEVSAFGWHRTGDVGYIDEDGYVYIVDRKKDMIISGGFNIFPSEIEQVIWSHPGVQDCAVIGVPDEKWGEAVKAVIERRPGGNVTEQEILELCRRSLGSVKTPKSVEFWDELPRSPVGKVRKKDIRDRFWAGTGRTI
ncbi:MAG TPA: AMP-binding protein [Zeimonas sp.]|nr:AMP-binding protein [Zeimonas sp.]